MLWLLESLKEDERNARMIRALRSPETCQECRRYVGSADGAALAEPCRRRQKKRCRMHGGAQGSGAPGGNQNALKHGLYTKEAVALRKHVRELLRDGEGLIEKM